MNIKNINRPVVFDPLLENVEVEGWASIVKHIEDFHNFVFAELSECRDSKMIISGFVNSNPPP